MTDYRIKVFKKASFCRHFENQVYKAAQNKHIKFPFYLSAGQEYIPAAIYTLLEEKGIDPCIYSTQRAFTLSL